MKNKVCCFTGHRDFRLSKDEVRRRLSEMIHYLVSKGVVYFGCGGALGFDTLAAQAVIEVKRDNPAVKLILVLPCKEQDKLWSEEDKQVYADIKEQADKVVYISETYTKTCMHERNRHLVNESGHCVALLERDSGGTFYTYNYAKKMGLKIYNLAESSYLG